MLANSPVCEQVYFEKENSGDAYQDITKNNKGIAMIHIFKRLGLVLLFVSSLTHAQQFPKSNRLKKIGRVLTSNGVKYSVKSCGHLSWCIERSLEELTMGEETNVTINKTVSLADSPSKFRNEGQKFNLNGLIIDQLILSRLEASYVEGNVYTLDPFTLYTNQVSGRFIIVFDSNSDEAIVIN